MNKSEKYADFWERMGAVCIDVFILYFVTWLGLALGSLLLTFLKFWYNFNEIIVISVPCILILLYFILFNYFNQATLGGMVFKLKLVNERGGKAHIIKIVVRDILFILQIGIIICLGFYSAIKDSGFFVLKNITIWFPLLLIILGVLPILITKNNQTWIDKLTGIYIIKK